MKSKKLFDVERRLYSLSTSAMHDRFAQLNGVLMAVSHEYRRALKRRGPILLRRLVRKIIADTLRGKCII